MKKDSSKRKIVFGKHLTIDAYECDFEKLASMEAIFDILNKLPEKIKMKKLAPPFVIKCPKNNKKDCGGISGFVIIAQSHISIHTFPKKKFLTMDVYSCGELDEKKVVNYIKRFFKCRKLEKHFILRGLNFPK